MYTANKFNKQISTNYFILKQVNNEKQLLLNNFNIILFLNCQCKRKILTICKLGYVNIFVRC